MKRALAIILVAACHGAPGAPPSGRVAATAPSVKLDTLADGARRVAAIGGLGNDVYVATSTAPALVSRDGGAHFAPAPSLPVPLLDRRAWLDGTSVFALDVERSAVVRKP